MEKKKLKNPITVIRKPEEINKEYSEIVIKLGQFELELTAIRRAHTDQENRKAVIEKEKEIFVARVDEITQEMNEAQQELKRKEEVKPSEAPLVNGALEEVSL